MPSFERDSNRIVIAGASSLLGAELRSLLEECHTAGNFTVRAGAIRNLVVLGSGGSCTIGGLECREAGGEIRGMKLKWGKAVLLGMSVALSLALAGCGYHVAGRSDSLPKSIHVIAVPALENKTISYRIEQRLTTATVHEFLVKTSYRVVPDPENADAVLRGKVLGLEAVPLLFDTATGRATTMLIMMKCEITFEERETGKILYHTDNFIFRNEYEISTDAKNPNSIKNFFEEQDPALDRMAQDFAARLVAAVVENY